VANLAHRHVEDTDWEHSEFSLYDLGQAVAHLTFQAASLGLSVRQFRAFDRAALADEFGVPDYWQVTTMAAVGRVPRAERGALPAEHDGVPPGRHRRPLHELRWGSA
jgi:hypothetical protein